MVEGQRSRGGGGFRGRGGGGFGGRDRGGSGRGRGGFGRGRGGGGDRGRGRGGSVGFGSRGGFRGGSRGGKFGDDQERSSFRGSSRGDSRGGSRGGSRGSSRGDRFGGQDRGSFRGGNRGGGSFDAPKREFMTDGVYVGQLPVEIQESDLKKMFPKATKISLTSAEGTRPGHAFLSFGDDASAAAAVKQGATFKNTPLKIGFQNKRGEPQKRSTDADDRSGPKAKKLKGDPSAKSNGSKAKGKQAAGSDDEEGEDDDDDDESMDFDGEDDDDEDEDESDAEDETEVKKPLKGKAAGKPAAGKKVEEDDEDDEDEDDDESDDDDDEEDDDEEEEEEKPAKVQKTPVSSAKQTTPVASQDKTKGKAPLTKPTVIDNSLQKKNKPANQTVVTKPTSAEAQKRTVDVAHKSGPQAKKLKNETPATGKNGLKGKESKNDDEDDEDDDDDDDDDDELDFDEEDDDEDDDEEDDEEEQTPKKPATGKQAKLAAKPSVAQDDEDDSDDDEDDDDDDDDEVEEVQKPTKTAAKPTPSSKKTKPAAKPSAAKVDEDDDDDDDDDDEEEEAAKPTPALKSALKQTLTTPSKQKASSTPTKTESKPTPKASTPAADKPLDKMQLFINSIKESVSVSEMKLLYPKAKSVKMQKRKVGPNHKAIQFAFVTFENESDCTEAFKAHSQIGGEKVNVSYAFAQSGKKQEKKPANTNNDANKKQEKTPPAKQTPAQKKEKTKPAVEKELSTNAIYVGQLPEHVVEDDVKKLFPKALKVELIAAKAANKGVRPGFAFVTFADDNAAAAAIKLGPSLTLKNTQLKVAYQTKRATTAE